jgi:hypothetical protein
MVSKKCTTCKITKEITEFNKNKSTNDGFHSQCKECLKEYRLKRKTLDPDYKKILEKGNQRN